MDSVHQQLQETLQTLYRKAVDADARLDQLQQQQKGKFAAIFAEDSGFTTRAKRFSPYVEEIAQDWQALKTLPEDEAKAAAKRLADEEARIAAEEAEDARLAAEAAATRVIKHSA